MRDWTQRQGLRLITELSITPLLSLVLALLLVFMVLGPVLQDSAAPEKPALGTAPSSVILLKAGKDQTLSLDGRPVMLADLKKAVENVVKEKQGIGVLVQMHRDLPVRSLVELMEILRQAGVQKTAVTTVEK